MFGDWNTRGIATKSRWDANYDKDVLRANFAWSPDSRYLAQIQTVMGEERTAITRLAIFDIKTGEMQIIARLSSILDEVGYAVFWFDEGLVLYSDFPGEDIGDEDTITVMNPDGSILHTWNVERDLNRENPIHYEGKDYLYFGGEYIYDVSTNEYTLFEGAVGLVSAAAPNTSLVVEACIYDTYSTTWDVYSAQGEKLITFENSSSFRLSPDGQQLAYLSPEKFDDINFSFNLSEETNISIYSGHGDRAADYQTETGDTVQTPNMLWGRMIYTITEVGAHDCLRSALG
jgi:hypothetical protein